MATIWKSRRPSPPPGMSGAAITASSEAVTSLLGGGKARASPGSRDQKSDSQPFPGQHPEPDQEPDVVDRHQTQPQHLLSHEQVTQISTREPDAGLAVTRGVQRLIRQSEPGG